MPRPRPSGLRQVALAQGFLALHTGRSRREVVGGRAWRYPVCFIYVLRSAKGAYRGTFTRSCIGSGTGSEFATSASRIAGVPHGDIDAPLRDARASVVRSATGVFAICLHDMAAGHLDTLLRDVPAARILDDPSASNSPPGLLVETVTSMAAGCGRRFLFAQLPIRVGDHGALLAASQRAACMQRIVLAWYTDDGGAWR